MEQRSQTRIPDIRADISKRTIREMISDKIVSLIASGVLQLGDELPSERELATILSVSRETVRSAIQLLVGRDIVEVSHGARTRVKRIDVATDTIGMAGANVINRYDLRSVHGARQLVELQVVSDAAEHIDRQTLAFLQLSLKKQREYVDDPVGFLICDKEFHFAIYRCAPNPLLVDLVSDLYSYMLEHRRIVMAQPGAIARSYGDHLVIYEALASGDRAATAEAFRRHINEIYLTSMPVMEPEKTDHA
ncbi:FadR/GntR family transcriptional regulator [Dongia soli]|uniref:FCD domain-containing protein n=1 Tax=Dongia soli TaxID=600628 RepID=A0ABU5E8R8_9PROT|nr:FCD domain-containing protein [Dongia soli]MDY0882608.1 FCD domain-containing protein [Dongia soli]